MRWNFNQSFPLNWTLKYNNYCVKTTRKAFWDDEIWLEACVNMVEMVLVRSPLWSWAAVSGQLTSSCVCLVPTWFQHHSDSFPFDFFEFVAQNLAGQLVPQSCWLIEVISACSVWSLGQFYRTEPSFQVIVKNIFQAPVYCIFSQKAHWGARSAHKLMSWHPCDLSLLEISA